VGDIPCCVPKQKRKIMVGDIVLCNEKERNRGWVIYSVVY